jgi:hypothetical protein
MANDSLDNTCAEVDTLGLVEVDGVCASDLYETPAQIASRIGPRTAKERTAYSGCQSCVFNQCVYSRT